MAEILQGLSSHKSHAPLSHGQTLAICQHLQQISLSNSNKIEELLDKFSHTDAERNKIRNDVVIHAGSLEELRGQLETVRTHVGKNTSEASNATALAERLKVGLFRISEDIGLLRDGQKVTNTNVHNLKGDLTMRGDDIAGLRAEVDDILKKRISYLQEKQNTTMLSLKQVTSEHEVSKQELLEQKDWLRGLGTNLNNVLEEVRRLDSSVKQHAATVAEATVNIDRAKSNLEMTNSVVLKLNEGLESVQFNGSSLQENVRSMEAYVQRLSDEHGKTVRGVNSTREGLVKATAATEQTREELTKALNDVTALQQDQSKTHGVVNKLNTDIQRVRISAAGTQANLEATKAIVLPNLGADELTPMSFSTTMDTTSRSLGPGSRSVKSQSSPRKRREATWTSRNVGVVPDRMSWI